MGDNVLKGFLAAYSRKDMDGALALVDPAAEFIAVRPQPSPDVSLYGTYHGHDGVRRFFGKLAEAFEPQRFTIDKVMEDAENAVAWGHLTHRVRATGLVFDSAWAAVCAVKDGRITRYRFFEDTAALETSFGL
ncbi:MAG TPA: nuclear transport factor 2 family protein [Azospirillaceae bacterium]|nr:nuclear transport factor 2 family protein [Azospirillaceae bacterium]